MKKLLCMLLALMMLASLLVACANDQGTEDGTKGEQSEQETGDPNYTDNVPDLSFGDETVTILSRDKFGVNDEFYAESSSDTQSDVVAYAVYTRNMAIEDRLDIKLEMLMDDTDPTAKHSTAVKSGSADYDIVADSTFVIIQAVLKGEFVNLRDMQYMDLDKYYWTQGYNDIVSFGENNKQYLASGALALSMFRYMFVTVYNREAFEKELRSDLMYYYWSKTEWEVIVSHWPPTNNNRFKEAKIFDETSKYNAKEEDFIKINGAIDPTHAKIHPIVVSPGILADAPVFKRKNRYTIFAMPYFIYKYNY